MASPLAQIPHNRHRGQHLTPIQRDIILGAHSQGATRTNLAAASELSWNMGDNTIKNASSRANGIYSPRSGLSNVMAKREERILVRIACENPFWSYHRLLAEFPFIISKATAMRHLKAYGLVNWRAKERQLLSQKTADIRLAWCKAHVDWTEEDWYKVIFSDECLIERGAGKGIKWVWRHTGQAFDKDEIQPRNKAEYNSVISTSR
jgi:hypothetical protein